MNNVSLPKCPPGLFHNELSVQRTIGGDFSNQTVFLPHDSTSLRMKHQVLSTVDCSTSPPKNWFFSCWMLVHILRHIIYLLSCDNPSRGFSIVTSNFIGTKISQPPFLLRYRNVRLFLPVWNRLLTKLCPRPSHIRLAIVSVKVYCHCLS
jgi:hypothetical protein